MPCSPGMSSCRAGCGHRALVMAYRVERHRQEMAREAVTGGYATELAEHPPLITFAEWLTQHAADVPDDEWTIGA